MKREFFLPTCEHYCILRMRTSIPFTIAEMEKYGGFWSRPDADYIRTLTPQRRAAIEERVARQMPKVQRSALIVCADGKCVFKTGAM